MDTPEEPGARKARTARNDAAILAAAREVFVRYPEAPVSAVAKVAGVGISALYRRYRSKEALLAQVSLGGLREAASIARAALAVGDPWEAFAGLLRATVDADVYALTAGLGGRFRLTPEHDRVAAEAWDVARQVLVRAQEAGVVRDDLAVEDFSLVYEQLASVWLGSAQRSVVLRRRYVELALDGMRATGPGPGVGGRVLPGEPPTTTELATRWVVRA